MIKLECKRSALRAARDLELNKAKTKAREAKDQEAVIEAEAEACFTIEDAKLEAEVKLLELSEHCLSYAIGAVPWISFSVNQSTRVVRSFMALKLQRCICVSKRRYPSVLKIGNINKLNHTQLLSRIEMRPRM